jgi:hypothetical protein
MSIFNNEYWEQIMDHIIGEYIPMPQKMKDFYQEIDIVCKKYNLSIFHEDRHGSFMIEEYKKDNIDWFKNASKDYR